MTLATTGKKTLAIDTKRRPEPLNPNLFRARKGFADTRSGRRRAA